MAQTSIQWRNFGVHGAVDARPLAPPTLPGLAIVGALAALALALLGCALLSLRTAEARRSVDRLDAETAQARREVTVLEKDLAVRARFGELDRWNGVLALRAPRSGQYVALSALATYAPQRGF